MNKPDVVVIGGGIAGAAAAAEIAAFASVVLLERESHCGYHSTGRSAASLSENYGTTVVRRLVIASRSFLDAPPPGFCDHPLLTPQPSITIARSDQLALLEEQLKLARVLVPSIVPISPAEVFSRVPILREGYVAGAYIEPNSMEIDVHALHQGYLRMARARGARIAVDAEVTAIARQAGRWSIVAGAQSHSAEILVNAAGAWADTIAAMAGIAPLGLVAKRRTAFTVAAPSTMNVRDWPMVDDVGEEFYFKPDAGNLFVSPADATPCAACDAYPEDADIAAGVERLERATHLDVKRVLRSWAGLRTFARDATPVVGADAAQPTFHWLAGQGGYGIKTSPALSQACAALIGSGRLPESFAQAGIAFEDLTPQRLRDRC